jgi:uncharacterized membrane protein YccC
MTKETQRILGTLIAAVVCGLLMWLTKGEHGIGWFIFAMIIMW